MTLHSSITRSLSLLHIIRTLCVCVIFNVYHSLVKLLSLCVCVCVQVADFAWPHKRMPDLEKLVDLCRNLDSWLRADKQNILVLHCTVRTPALVWHRVLVALVFLVHVHEISDSLVHSISYTLNFFWIKSTIFIPKGYQQCPEMPQSTRGLGWFRKYIIVVGYSIHSMP